MADNEGNGVTPEPQIIQPGQTTSPASPEAPSPQAPVPPAEPLPPPAEPPIEESSGDTNEPEAYAPSPSFPADEGQAAVTWTASEFIAHHKTPGWYGMLITAAFALALLVWFVTKDLISAAVIVVGAGVLGAYGARPPRQLTYRLDDQGLSIDNRQYGYEQFRSFAVVREGAISGIVLTPLRRFSPLMSIYYAAEDEEQIVAMLSRHLPMDEHRHDAIDRFMNRIRF